MIGVQKFHLRYVSHIHWVIMPH